MSTWILSHVEALKQVSIYEFQFYLEDMHYGLVASDPATLILNPKP